MSLSRTGPLCCCTCSITQKKVSFSKLWCSFPKHSVPFAIKVPEFRTSTDKSRAISALKHDRGQSDKLLVISNAGEKKLIQKSGKKEHHLWQKRDSAGSGQKAMNLVCTVAKWMLSKGQGATMATYDCLLLAFDMDGRVDEAEMLWNMILRTYNRSISKRLFSRMIFLYDHHNVPDKVIEVFADMEELGVKPDKNTVGKIGRAFEVLGQEDKHRLFMMKYRSKWKYIHFKGERVRVKLES